MKIQPRDCQLSSKALVLLQLHFCLACFMFCRSLSCCCQWSLQAAVEQGWKGEVWGCVCSVRHSGTQLCNYREQVSTSLLKGVSSICLRLSLVLPILWLLSPWPSAMVVPPALQLGSSSV